MSDSHKSLRIGDLLVEKGLISAPQLRQAIDLQKFRISEESGASSNITKRYELGEILVELGYISRHQLAANLSWQKRLKATTAMMVFVAPLLTAACGGGAGTSNGGSTNQPSQNTSSQVVPDASSSSVSSVPTVTSKSSSSISSAPAPVVKSSSSVSSKASSKSSSSAASSKAVANEGAVQLYWSVPKTRENGDYLDITEIGGYEVRYKLKSDNSFMTVLIKDAFVDAYYFDYLKGDYQFEIATFDKSGLYSKFVPITPY